MKSIYDFKYGTKCSHCQNTIDPQGCGYTVSDEPFKWDYWYCSQGCLDQGRYVEEQQDICFANQAIEAGKQRRADRNPIHDINFNR